MISKYLSIVYNFCLVQVKKGLVKKKNNIRLFQLNRFCTKMKSTNPITPNLAVETLTAGMGHDKKL